MTSRKPVLYDRALKPEWVDFALEHYLRAEDEKTLRDDLQEWMAKKELGVYTVQKTARQLQRIVGFRSPLPRRRMEMDYERLRQLAPDQRHHIRLQLVADSNEFFADCASSIRALHLNGASSVTVSELYERLQGIYGYRGMIPRRVRYVLQTLAFFGCLVNEKRRWKIVEGSWLAQ